MQPFTRRPYAPPPSDPDSRCLPCVYRRRAHLLATRFIRAKLTRDTTCDICGTQYTYVGEAPNTCGDSACRAEFRRRWLKLCA